VITILGDDPAPIVCGSARSDAGATAVDSCGNSLTPIVVSNSVDSAAGLAS
jgi:hypothetical protein